MQMPIFAKSSFTYFTYLLWLTTNGYYILVYMYEAIKLWQIAGHLF